MEQQVVHVFMHALQSGESQDVLKHAGLGLQPAQAEALISAFQGLGLGLGTALL